jgi:glycosyltransferase involved in cell wall biosynthesis
VSAPSQERITVITLTRNRPLLVQRAIRSVRSQQTRDRVHHVILIDDCPQTRDALSDPPPGVEVRYEPRQPHEVSGPSRSSRLRNLGVLRSTDAWIAFLDDDNEWAPDHLETLMQCARREGARAVHSSVSLHNRDGSPYLEPRWPWARDPGEAERIYREHVAKGICVPGSNVVHDRPGRHDEPADTSSWLLARQLLLDVPFEEHFSRADAEGLIGEDDKLFRALLRRGEPIGCTHRATLRYYLGGYSNNVHGKTDATFAWATEDAG